MFSPSNAKNWKPASNRTKKKSKQGCRSCKTRKVKCDEKRPLCGNCDIYYSSRTQQCDYDCAILDLGQDEKTSTRAPKPKGLYGKHVKPNLQAFKTHPPGRRPPLVLSRVGGVSVDPFNTMARSELPSADQLLHHYFSAIIDKCLPAGHTPERNPLVDGLWQLFQADTFFHNVILQVSAVELEMIQGKPNTYHSDKYTRESIRMLRERIEEPQRSASNETISAVATLAALEYGKKNMTTMKMHVEGMKKMVNMRGGLSKIRQSSQSTATMIHWFTMVIMQDSIFPPNKRDDLSVDKSSRLYCLLPGPLYLSLDLFDIEDDIRILMERTRRFSEHLSSGIQGSANTPDDFHWQFNALLQRLCHLKIRAPANSSTAQYTEACRNATALFLFLPFDNHYPDPTLVVNGMLHKLKFALKDLVLSVGSQSQLLLWLLSIGGVTSLNLPERDWFVGNLVPLIAHLELRSWMDFANALEGMMYVRKFLDGAFRELWNDIKFATEALVEQDPYAIIVLESSLESRGSSITLAESEDTLASVASTSGNEAGRAE